MLISKEVLDSKFYNKLKTTSEFYAICDYLNKRFINIEFYLGSYILLHDCVKIITNNETCMIKYNDDEKLHLFIFDRNGGKSYGTIFTPEIDKQYSGKTQWD